ncbi:hypothetical protein HK405_004471 [Cladochytrium tenue]|nr:hypothetical protein HK405_004471 [Cladochytrium tenue]
MAYSKDGTPKQCEKCVEQDKARVAEGKRRPKRVPGYYDMIPNVAMYNEHQGWFKPPGVTLEPGKDLLLVIGTSFSREVEGARQDFFNLATCTKKGCVVYLNTSDPPCDVSKKFGWFLHGRAEDAAEILMRTLVIQALLTFPDKPEPADQPRDYVISINEFANLLSSSDDTGLDVLVRVSFTAFDLETLAVPLRIQPFVTQRCSVKVRDGTLTASSCVVKDGQVLEVADMLNFLLGRFGQFSLYVIFPEMAAKNENGTAYVNFTTSDFRGRFYDRILLPSIRAILSPEDQGQFPVDFKTGMDMHTKRNRDCMPSEIKVRTNSSVFLDCVDGMVCALELMKNQGGTHGVCIEWWLPATALSWASSQLTAWDPQCAVRAGALFRIPTVALFWLCAAVVKRVLSGHAGTAGAAAARGRIQPAAAATAVSHE